MKEKITINRRRPESIDLRHCFKNWLDIFVLSFFCATYSFIGSAGLIAGLGRALSGEIITGILTSLLGWGTIEISYLAFCLSCRLYDFLPHDMILVSHTISPSNRNGLLICSIVYKICRFYNTVPCWPLIGVGIAVIANLEKIITVTMQHFELASVATLICLISCRLKLKNYEMIVQIFNEAKNAENKRNDHQRESLNL